ncbi:MAG: STAS domain-containing protein [Spirochaetales bacterium]|nr:STAS domain-containing protein [Spirochaetales bacterium]
MDWEKSSPLYELDGCLVVPFDQGTNAVNVGALRRETLDRMANTGLMDVILDMSSLPILDRKTFQMIDEMARMIEAMGGGAVFTGIQPGVATIMVDMNVDTEAISAAYSIKESVLYFRTKQGRSESLPADEESFGGIGY